MAQAGVNFPKVRRMLFYLSPVILGCFWQASTLLHGHIALAIPSPPETNPQILEPWGYADEVLLTDFLVIVLIDVVIWLIMLII